jgi:ElaB/YqjD/DUF883 family membrane-anchored ribosome-binding protein
MLDDPQDPIQHIEVASGEPGAGGGSSQREFLDRAKEKLDKALEDAKEELTELVDEAKEELEELREKAPGWVKDARRKVADFLEPDEAPKKE